MIKTAYIVTLVYLRGTSFCCHTLALSECEGFCVDYLNELKKKKISRKAKFEKSNR